MKYILASKSPRRNELFSLVVDEFRTIVADVDERSVRADSPSELCMKLAELKCKAVAQDYAEDCVIGADTIVAVSGEVLGKPEDEEDAARMLRMLSGRSHHVLTGICIKAPSADIVTYCDTEVFFKDLSEEEIDEYIRSGDPFDKAGAYGIQNGAARFCRKISGDFFNVVGLPVNLVYEKMRGSGLL